VHTADLADSHYRQAPAAGAPTNWVAPVDYAGGSAWVHLEVLTKPTDEPTKFQVCFEGTPSYGCTSQSVAYTTVGTLEWETPFTNFYIPPNESVDWTKGTKTIAVILKDTMNGKPSADNVGATRAARFTPTEVRVVVTLVSKGSTYVKPPPYEPTTPDAGAPDAGADAGTGGAPTRGTGGAPSTGTGGAGGVAPAAGGAAAAAGGANGSGGKESGGATASAGASPDAGSGGSAASSSDDGGCAVTGPSASRAGAGLFAVLLATLFIGRRRQRSATQR
jgi:MYXO-CTERM domain-containing protein